MLLILLGYVVPALIAGVANWQHGRSLYLTDNEKCLKAKLARDEYTTALALYRAYDGDDEGRPPYPFTGSDYYYNPELRRYHLIKWFFQAVIPILNIFVAVCRILWDYNLIGWIEDQFKKPLVPYDHE